MTLKWLICYPQPANQERGGGQFTHFCLPRIVSNYHDSYLRPPRSAPCASSWVELFGQASTGTVVLQI